MSDLHSFRSASNFLPVLKEFVKTTHFNACGCLHCFQASACDGTCPGTAKIDKSAGNSTRKTPRWPPGRLHFTGQMAMQCRRSIACNQLRFLSHVLDRSNFFLNSRGIGTDQGQDRHFALSKWKRLHRPRAAWGNVWQLKQSLASHFAGFAVRPGPPGRAAPQTRRKAAL